MTWVKIDDSFSFHRKFHRAGPDGVALFIAGLCYCARHGTDGVINKTELDEVYPWVNLSREKIAGRLVSVGLWEEEEGRYIVHDYAEYQETSGEIRAKKAQAAARQKSRRERLRALTDDVTRDSRVGHVDGHAHQDSVSHAKKTQLVTRESRLPVPSRPDPSRVLEQEKENIKEKEIANVGAVAPVVFSEKDFDVAKVTSHYLNFYPKRSAQARDKKTITKIKERLKEGYTVEQLKQAVDGNRGSDFHREGGHNSLELIFRSASYVDRFIAIANDPLLGKQLSPQDRAAIKSTQYFLEHET